MIFGNIQTEEPPQKELQNNQAFHWHHDLDDIRIAPNRSLARRTDGFKAQSWVGRRWLASQEFRFCTCFISVYLCREYYFAFCHHYHGICCMWFWYVVFWFRNRKTSGFLFPGPNQKYHVHVPAPSCQRCHGLFHSKQCFGVAKVTFYDLETMILKGTDFQHLQQQLKARHKNTKNASRTSIRNFWFRQSGLFWLARGRGLCVWVHFHPMFFASCQRHAFAPDSIFFMF